MIKILPISILIFVTEYTLLVTNNLFLILFLVALFYLLVKQSWVHAIGLSILLFMLFPCLSHITIGQSYFSGYRINFSILFILWIILNLTKHMNNRSELILYKNDQKLWIILLIAFSVSAIYNDGLHGLRNTLLYWGFILGLYIVYNREINGLEDLKVIGKYVFIGIILVFFASLYEFTSFQKFYLLFPDIYASTQIYEETTVQLRQNIGRATVFTQHSCSLSHIIALFSILLLFIYDLSKSKIYFFGFLISVLIIFMTQAKTGLLILLSIIFIRITNTKKALSILVSALVIIICGYYLSNILRINILSNMYINLSALIFPYSGLTEGQALNTIKRFDVFLQYFEWSMLNNFFGVGLKPSGEGWSSWADANKFVAILFRFGLWGLIFWTIFWFKALFNGFQSLLTKRMSFNINSYFTLSIFTFIVGYFATYFPEPDFLISLPFAIFNKFKSTNYLQN